MDWNNNDPFDSIMREFFGEPARGRRREEKVIEGEEEERVIDFIEGKDKVYVIFELAGYSDKDVMVSVGNGKIEVIAKKRESEGIQAYLSMKLKKGVNIKKSLPSFINTKRFERTFKNGILEVSFDKK